MRLKIRKHGWRSRRRPEILLTAVLLTAGPAVAQTHVGSDAYSGLHWSVAAPEGASWTLECRFRPVTVWISTYERNRWMNVMNQAGQGSARGRLPGDNGRCTLTKTGGVGPVGIALVKNGAATASGTRDPATPAKVTVF
jgi:pyruvate dehydrogenase complex dehydrogenase (E1) component